jgi:carbon starvation protein CstA
VTDQGTVFAGFVREQLEAERKRREALDQRGLETAKTTGTLITLVLGFAALILGVDYKPQSRFASLSLSLALLLLIVSIGIAIAATRLLRYAVTDKSGLDEILQNRWDSTEANARSTVAQLTANTVDTLRTGNNSKASKLDVAHWLQLAGLALLVVTVAAEVIKRSF